MAGGISSFKLIMSQWFLKRRPLGCDLEWDKEFTHSGKEHAQNKLQWSDSFPTQVSSPCLLRGEELSKLKLKG